MRCPNCGHDLIVSSDRTDRLLCQARSGGCETRWPLEFLQCLFYDVEKAKLGLDERYGYTPPAVREPVYWLWFDIHPEHREETFESRVKRGGIGPQEIAP